MTQLEQTILMWLNKVEEDSNDLELINKMKQEYEQAELESQNNS